ncbi:MAG TPA: hypothetical protein VF331_13740 [Polyangiales bacterium]
MAIPRALTADGFEMQLGVNHFGHLALTGLLLDRLLGTPQARVVSVTSQASNMGQLHWEDLDFAQRYNKWYAYAQSKLANLVFRLELARRLADQQLSLRSVACHPGYAATNLQLVGPSLEGSRLARWVMQAGNRLLAQSADVGAWPTRHHDASHAIRSRCASSGRSRWRARVWTLACLRDDEREKSLTGCARGLGARLRPRDARQMLHQQAEDERAELEAEYDTNHDGKLMPTRSWHCATT